MSRGLLSRISVGALLACGALAAEPQVLQREPDLAARAPAEAWQRAGGWDAGDSWAVTGHSITLDALGEATARRTERESSEDDARRWLALAVVFWLPGREAVFLVAFAPKSAARVKVVFSPGKARTHALRLFAAGEYSAASQALSTFTRCGVQDPEMLAYTRAASAQVNLDASIEGEARCKALETRARLYEQRGQSEQSLERWYRIYRETSAPDRPLLEKLAIFAARTYRRNSAASFCQEIERRWPASAQP